VNNEEKTIKLVKVFSKKKSEFFSFSKRDPSRWGF